MDSQNQYKKCKLLARQFPRLGPQIWPVILAMIGPRIFFSVPNRESYLANVAC